MTLQDAISRLQHEKELLPDEYDGSYKLMRDALNCYSHLRNTAVLDHSDLDLIYAITLRTTRYELPELRLMVENSHLLHTDKKILNRSLEVVWDTAVKRKYALAKDEEDIGFGLFKAKFRSFKGYRIGTRGDLVQDLFRMFIQIMSIENETDEEIYDLAEKVLNVKLKDSGITTAVASYILHCIKPFTFPILTGNDNHVSIFELAEIELEYIDDISFYIGNCRKIKAFRDENFRVKNYRLFDIAAEDLAVAEILNEVGIEFTSDTTDDIFTVSSALNQILYGPPGTGKTYNTVKHAVALIEGKTNEGERYENVKKRFDEYCQGGRIKFTTFHQSFSYEEFVEGIRPVIVDRYGKESTSAHSETNVVYRVYDGVFKSFCDRARKNPHLKYVAVIDEINRGNISKIFGELITLIEDTKRGMSAVLPFSQKEFTVPANVYILGTMNTADRSIAMLDTALRRRFDFTEMMPVPELLGDCEGVDLCELLTAINQRIEYYYDREHSIGHAYFMDSAGPIKELDTLRKIFCNKVIPLLQEYFFDDYEKIKLILNDEDVFIKTVKPRYIKTFDSDQRIYRIGEPSGWSVSDFRRIYLSDSGDDDE